MSYGTGWNLHCGMERFLPEARSAVCSVACLAWLWWMAYPPVVSRPGTPRELTLETIAAKEAKNRVGCSGNHLGCPRGAGVGIAVRTKWQFGPGDGNIPARALKGNRHDGDAWQPPGKSNRTSSRKINLACRHSFYECIGLKCKFRAFYI